MKKMILPLLLVMCSTSNLFAQSIDLPADSVTSLLCRKWEINYALVDGMKIERAPGAQEMNFEFKKDKTFIESSNGKTASVKGTWSFDPKRKLIKLVTDGKVNSNIIELRDGEFVLLVDTKKATPDDPTPIKTYFKPKS